MILLPQTSLGDKSYKIKNKWTGRTSFSWTVCYPKYWSWSYGMFFCAQHYAFMTGLLTSNSLLWSQNTAFIWVVVCSWRGLTSWIVPWDASIVENKTEAKWVFRLPGEVPLVNGGDTWLGQFSCAFGNLLTEWSILVSWFNIYIVHTIYIITHIRRYQQLGELFSH